MPTQSPPWQVSGAVQLLPSLQGVPSGSTRSGGQAAELPLQLSATSHVDAAARQTVPVGFTASAGQLLVAPSQVSATSQAPAAARHCAVLF
jgi:hypothetical protein